MSSVKPVPNILAEATTTEISKNENPKGLSESKGGAKWGRKVAGEARRVLEKETGSSAVTMQNAKELKRLE